MLSATFLDLTSDEIMTVGEVAIGDFYNGYCCDGHAWEVVNIFPNQDADHNSIWGVCHNPECPKYQEEFGPSDPYRGVSSVLQCDFAEWLAMVAGDVEPEARR